jgi:hypothetical protein
MLDNMVYSVDDSFIHFIHELEKLFDRWRAANRGVDLPDPQKIHYLVKAVTAVKVGDFKSVVTHQSLVAGVTYQQLKNVVLTYEQQYKSTPEWNKRKVQQATAATTSVPQQGGKKKGKKNKGGKAEKASNRGTSSSEALTHWCPNCNKMVLHEPEKCWSILTCTYCGKRGHPESRCHDLRKRLSLEKKKLIENAVAAAQSSSNHQGKA